MTIRTQGCDLYFKSADELRVDLAVEQRDHRTTRKWLTGHRWLAFVGWAVAITVLGLGEAHAGDCEKLAAFKQNQAKHLQLDYMQLHVPPVQWNDFIKDSDKLLDERYAAELAQCKVEVKS